jgi:hypothetical protein
MKQSKKMKANLKMTLAMRKTNLLPKSKTHLLNLMKNPLQNQNLALFLEGGMQFMIKNSRKKYVLS